MKDLLSEQKRYYAARAPAYDDWWYKRGRYELEPDALAFPLDGLDEVPDGLPRQLGDVVMCPSVVGEEWGKPLVHALLHLVGYDHGADMEAREELYA